MHVAFVRYGRPEQRRSGGDLYDHELIRQLLRRGDHVRWIGLPEGSRPARLLHNLSRSTVHAMLSPRPEVIVQDELCHPSLLAANRLLRLRGGPPVVTLVHHLFSDEPEHGAWRGIHRGLERAYLRSCDGVLANTRATLARVARLDRRPDVPAHVAYPAATLPATPIGDDELDARLARRGPLRVLFVGNLIPRKQLGGLLDAVKILLQRGEAITLTVVGGHDLDPEYAATIRRRARPLERAGVVKFTGSLRDDALARRYREADVLCVPSSHEGFGMVYLEGMGFGLPAIGAASGGAKEIIRDGECGWTVPGGDRKAIVARLQALRADPDRLARMSFRARTAFLQHPGWHESMEGAARFLQAVAEGSRRPRDRDCWRQALSEMESVASPRPGERWLERDVPAYLQAKEQVDAAARNRQVLTALRSALAERATIDVLEAGAGLGGLAWDLGREVFACPVRYTLLDSDGEPLEWARRRFKQDPLLTTGGHPMQIAMLRRDLSGHVSAHPPPVDLLVAQSLLDLMPLNDALSCFERLLRPGGYLYAPVTVDGDTVFSPPGPDQELERRIYRAYRDSVDSRARDIRGRIDGGHRAGSRLLERLRSRDGWDIIAHGRSDWRVHAADDGGHVFLHRILGFYEETLQRSPVITRDDAESWLSLRRSQLADRTLSLHTPNRDVLARFSVESATTG